MRLQITDSIPICFNVQIVSSDENELTIHRASSSISARKGGNIVAKSSVEVASPNNNLAKDWHQKDLEILEQQHQTEQDMNPSAFMLKTHYKLKHLPFSKIKTMAVNGTLDRKLADCRIPVCAACSYGRATKIPWKTKSSTSHIGARLMTAPGLCISVGQMQSLVPGLVAHMKGLPTKCRYSAATVFVDHYSWMGYVHLQETLTASDTLQAKQAFERHCESFGIKVRQYHANNRHFGERAFIEDVQQQGQTISYCRVNAHFQNGIAENASGTCRIWHKQ